MVQDAVRERIKSAIEASAARRLVTDISEDHASAIVREAGRLADSILWELRHEYRIVRRALPERSGT